MEYNKEIFSITRREEFESSFFFADKSYVLYNAEPIINNSFYYAKDINRFHIKKDNTVYGASTFYIPNLRLGDRIEVEFEYQVVSTANDGIIRVSFNEIEVKDSSKTPIIKTYYDCPYNNGEWNKANATYMATNDSFSNHLIEIGMPWWKTGEVYIKDLRVIVYRKIPRLENSLKGCMIRKNGSNWEIRSDFYGNDIGTITVKDSTTLSIAFKDKFENRPVSTSNADTNTLSGKYRPCVGALTQLGCDIKFIKNDNTFSDLSAMEDGVHFSFMFLGSLRL